MVPAGSVTSWPSVAAITPPPPTCSVLCDRRMQGDYRCALESGSAESPLTCNGQVVATPSEFINQTLPPDGSCLQRVYNQEITCEIRERGCTLEMPAETSVGLDADAILVSVPENSTCTQVDTQGAAILGEDGEIQSLAAGDQITVATDTSGNATVTVCHTGTPKADLPRFTRDADILVVAAGSPEAITGEMIRPGAVVIDVGVNRVDDPASEKGYRLVGDVRFAEAKEVAGAITPVPGGVGPMTIAMLMKNTVQAARQAA